MKLAVRTIVALNASQGSAQAEDLRLPINGTSRYNC
jgi:hypothetical protein